MGVTDREVTITAKEIAYQVLKHCGYNLRLQDQSLADHLDLSDEALDEILDALHQERRTNDNM